MFSRGTRAALSRRQGQWAAGIFDPSENRDNQQEREPDAASQRESLKRPDCSIDVNMNKNHRFAHNTKIPGQRSENLRHCKLNSQCEARNERDSGIQPVNQLVYLRAQHQQLLAPIAEQDAWTVHPAIQAELAEFWAQRAQARQEYRKSKALREAAAMVTTMARSTRPTQRAASELAGGVRARVHCQVGN